MVTRRPKTRKRYTPEQKAAALELYAEIGGPETSKRTGIPRPTIANWASEAGIRAPESELAARFSSRPLAFPETEDLPPETQSVPGDYSGADDPEADVRRYVAEERAAILAAKAARASNDSMGYQRYMTGAGIAGTKAAEARRRIRRDDTPTDPAELDRRIMEMFATWAARSRVEGVHRDQEPGAGPRTAEGPQEGPGGLVA